MIDFGKKTVDKISAIIVEAVANKKAETKHTKEDDDTKTDSAVDPVLEEIKNG